MAGRTRRARVGVAAEGSLAGRHVLLTAGPTRAPIDRVRYVANRSSGATGMAVARALLRRGAVVHVVYGPGTARPPTGVDLRAVETPEEMRRAALDVLGAFPVAAGVFAAAVLDFVPAQVREGKVPSDRPLVVEFVPTPKIIDELVRACPSMVAVGFKLEWGLDDAALVSAARRLIERDRLSAVVANDLARIAGRRHPALLVAADGAIVRVSTNAGLAAAIVRHLETSPLPSRGRGG